MKHRLARPTGPRLLAGRRWVVAVLGLVSVTLIVLAVPRGDVEPRGARQTPSTQVSPQETRHKPVRGEPPTAPTAPTVPTAPTGISIPAIDVSTDLIRLGVNDDDTVEVPENGDDAGWFDLGPVPGQDGSAVILGHVDSLSGPAIFYRLKELEPGDRIQVGLDNGSVEIFEVDRVATHPNEEFPAQQVYAGSPNAPALNLVTCGGTYDRANGGWQANVVVSTKHVRTLAAR